MMDYQKRDTYRRESLRESDPEVFRALNILKEKGVVYSRYNPKEYQTLLNARSIIEEALSYDDCRLMIAQDQGTVMISVNPDDDYEYHNRLRVRFNADEMRLYAVLYTLYDENYLLSGDFVSITIDDIRQKIDAFKTSDNGKTSVNSSSDRAIIELMKTMKRYGLANTAGNGYILNPGIRFGIDVVTFQEYYKNVVYPWLEKNNAAGKETWGI